MIYHKYIFLNTFVKNCYEKSRFFAILLHFFIIKGALKTMPKWLKYNNSQSLREN